MKRPALPLFGLLIALIAGAHPQIATAQPTDQPAVQPAARAALLHEAIGILSTQPLGRDSIDWPAVEGELAASLPANPSRSDLHAAIAAAVARLNDPHARFFPPPEPAPLPSEPPAQAPAPDRAPAKPAPPQIPAFPEGRVLEDGAAYLIVPGCPAPDAAGLRDYAARASAELLRLHAQSPKAWVIDLRLNGGGNLWPMLLGLRPLLGDGPLITSVDGTRIVNHFGIGPDCAWIDWGSGPEAQLEWARPAPDAMPMYDGRIAFLLGPWTMSSGEALALCLAGRDNTRSFGEPTAGLTTVTNYFPLSDGSVLNLPVSQMGTRAGAPAPGPISPDQSVKFDDWPTPDDAPALAARAWALEAPNP